MLWLSIISGSREVNNSVETQTADLPGSFRHPIICCILLQMLPSPSSLCPSLVVNPPCQPSECSLAALSILNGQERLAGVNWHVTTIGTAGLGLNMCIIFGL